MKTRSIVLGLSLLILAALACNLPATSGIATVTPTVTPPTTEQGSPTSTPQPEDTPTGEDEATPAVEPTDAPEPSATPTITVAVPSDGEEPPAYGDLVYETDFLTRWQNLVIGDETNPQGRSSVTDEGYLFELVKDWGHWVYTARAEESAFYAEITARAVDCPASDGGYGLMFHYVDNDNLRAFAITCNGGYTLIERSAATGTTLASGKLPGGVNPSAGEHTIAVQASANQLTLYVDGTQVDRVDVTDMPRGDFGPYAKSADQPLKILFTRMAIYEAP